MSPLYLYILTIHKLLRDNRQIACNAVYSLRSHRNDVNLYLLSLDLLLTFLCSPDLRRAMTVTRTVRVRTIWMVTVATLPAQRQGINCAYGKLCGL